MKTRSVIHASILALLSISSASVMGQGSLVPPGAPAPMMKTLQQIEPRRPISSLPFVINQPGSYYIETNLVGIAGQHGITVTANDVSLDLRGFELRGVGGSLSAIFLNGASGLRIHNGQIRGWGRDGIDGNFGGAALIENLRVAGNSRYGISINSGSQVRQCIVSANGQVGIITSNHVEVDDCVSGSNGTHGIQCGTGSNVRRCLTTGNGAAGITGSGLDGFNILDCNTEVNNVGIAIIGQAIVKNSFARSNRVAGISVGDGSNVIGCNASDNGTAATPTAHGITVGGGSTVRDCTTRNNGGDGINASFGCTVADNSCRDNLGDNIEVSQECLVAQNACDDDGANRGQSGIRVASNNNRIENNTVTETTRGLWITSPDNVVLNNTVLRNNTNYVIVAGNQLDLLLSQLPESIPWAANVKLAGSLRGTSSANGITILTNDVTIDLGGHALIGTPGSLDGILVSGSRTNIVIRNGAVRNWGSDGIQANVSYNSSFSNLRVANNGANGLQGGNGASISGVTARGNGADGITTASGCVISDSASSENRSDGIVATTGTTVTSCSAYNNGFDGIRASAGSTVSTCTSYSNTNGISASDGSTVVNCTVSANATNGIVIGFGSSVTGCTIRDNRTGINVGDDCRVVNNAIDNANAAGIMIRGGDNRIDANNVSDSLIGIDCNLAGNLIIRNSAAGNTTNYSIVAGNTVGPVLGVANPIASTNPWANFGF